MDKCIRKALLKKYLKVACEVLLGIVALLLLILGLIARIGDEVFLCIWSLVLLGWFLSDDIEELHRLKEEAKREKERKLPLP